MDSMIEKIIIVIIVIIIIAMLVYLFIDKNNKNKQTGLGNPDDAYDEIIIPYHKHKLASYNKISSFNLFKPNNNSSMKVYQSTQTYDSTTGKMKVDKQYDEYCFKDDKWENTFSKHFDDSYNISKDDLKFNLIDLDSPDINENELKFGNETIDDYAFKLDRVEGGNAYYKLVKLTENEKNQFYGGESASKDDEEVEIEINQNENENVDQHENEKSQEQQNDQHDENENSQSENSQNEDQKSTIESKISNSFPDLSADSFNKVKELKTISINGQLKTISKNQLDNFKKSIAGIKEQTITLAENAVTEITKYITDITTSFAAAITKITTYIAEVAANPIDLLIKWLANAKTIITLGTTAIKVGIKNATNILRIVHPTEFILNMIYNDMSAFISILRSFYNAIIYSKIIKEIKNAFNSIIKPFKNNATKVITFLKPYISSLYDILTELFNLFTPSNLEKLLQDCLKILFDKDANLKGETDSKNNNKKKIKLSKEEVKRKVNDVFNILKEYMSKILESIKAFGNNFKDVFDKIVSFIQGNVDDYSVPEEELGKLDF